MELFDGMLEDEEMDVVGDIESQRVPVAFENADVAATDLEFVKPEFGDVRRVPSFVNLDDLEVAGTFDSMPVFGMSPKPHEQLRDSSPEEDGNNNSNDNVAMEQEDDSMVVAATPKPQLISSYSMEAISSVREIETMSGPLLRGYLKSVGIEHRGNSKKRSELMQMLTREFLRFREDPHGYMEAVAELRPPAQAGAADGFTEPSSGTRRTKKRSLKAREADETRDVVIPTKKLTLTPGTPAAATSPPLAPVSAPTARTSLSPTRGLTSPPANGSSNGQPSIRKPKTKLAVSKDPTQMTDEARLARYEAIARQAMWIKSGGAKAPSVDKSELLQEFCSMLGFNAQGVAVTEEEQKEPAVDEVLDPLGKRIDVLWMEDLSNTPKWYTGTVVKKVARSYQVMYDDGEERAENLKTKRWRFSRTGFFGQ